MALSGRPMSPTKAGVLVVVAFFDRQRRERFGIIFGTAIDYTQQEKKQCEQEFQREQKIDHD